MVASRNVAKPVIGDQIPMPFRVSATDDGTLHPAAADFSRPDALSSTSLRPILYWGDSPCI